MTYAQDMTPIFDSLAALDAQRGYPHIAIAASWFVPRSHDLDEHAARIFLDVLEHTLAVGEGAEVGLVLMFRGGFAVFADSVRRSLAPLMVKSACLLTSVTGAATPIALLAQELELAMGAGLGSAATGTIGPVPPAWAPEFVDGDREDLFSREEPERRRMLAMARERRERELLSNALALSFGFSGIDEDQREALISALGFRGLGAQLALGARELEALGVSARWIDGDARATTRRLALALEDLLGLKKEPAPAYTASGIGTEVEFEMASGEPGAVIASSERAWLLELDTGRPDPDTGLYQGDWLQLR
jgi:hypothetical protein